MQLAERDSHAESGPSKELRAVVAGSQRVPLEIGDKSAVIRVE
jgi:hypothetical protein